MMLHSRTRLVTTQAYTIKAGTPALHPLAKPVVVQVRAPRRCCQRSRVLTSADLLPKRAPAQTPRTASRTPAISLPPPARPLSTPAPCKGPRYSPECSWTCAATTATPAVKKFFDGAYNDDWLSQQVTVELDWHAVPHAQKLTGEDGIWDPLSYPSLDYSADILGHSWRISITALDDDKPLLVNIAPEWSGHAARELDMLKNVRCSVALLNHKDAEASPKSAEEGINFIEDVDEGWTMALGNIVLDSAGASKFTSCFVKNGKLTFTIGIKLLSPMPQEAHAADMVLVAEDGQAHLIHSLLVQRLSPGMLGTMIAAARAQHGTGGNLRVQVPGTSMQVRLLQQLVYADDLQDWVKTVSVSNLVLLVEFLHKAQAKAKTMNIIDTELASRPATSIPARRALPFLLAAKQANLPGFETHCTSMVTAAPLPDLGALDGHGSDTIMVYMKAMKVRMQRVKQLIEQAIKEPQHDDLLAKALAELT